MQDDILTLALDLSRNTADKISSIDMIMVKTQMLAMNARLEAARAGEVGKSFAVVAQEMGEVTKEVSALSAGLRTAASLAMLDPAPGRFSTTTGWPSTSAIFGAMARAEMSTAPPGV